MAQETGKERRSRIDLYHYRAPDDAARLRGRLTLLALALAGGWIAIAPAFRSGRATDLRLFQQNVLTSKGPLARSHAAWETACETCHVPFKPINGSQWGASLWNGSRASDAKCQNCHAGPAHHANQLPAAGPACAECHHDHQGREASLLAMDDAVCTSCHQRLAEHRGPGACARRWPSR